MLAVLVSYINRLLGWENTEEENRENFNGISTLPKNKELSSNHERKLNFTKTLFSNETNEESNQFSDHHRRLGRYRAQSATGDLQTATSSSSLITNRHQKRLLKTRADTVGGLSFTSQSTSSKTSPHHSDQSSNVLKFPFELWFENSNQQKPVEKPKFGNLEFTTYYDSSDNSFAVKVIRATDLPVMDLFGLTDPFVKCCLLPDRKRKLETKVKRRTLNPHWNEQFMFQGLSIEKIKHRILSLQVYDFDRFSRNDPIGDVFLPLKNLQINEENFHSVNLTESRGSNKRGELQLSLCYQPLEGILDVAVVKARNLKPMDINGTSDPYVKVWLIYRGKKVEKKKTYIIKKTLNPTFEEEFTFLTPMKKMRETQLEITVMDYDKIGRNDTIGKVYLGHKSSGLEKQHWKDMLNSARQPVTQWHVLKV